MFEHIWIRLNSVDFQNDKNPHRTLQFTLDNIQNAVFQKFSKTKFRPSKRHRNGTKTQKLMVFEIRSNQAQQCKFNTQIDVFKNRKHEICMLTDLRKEKIMLK